METFLEKSGLIEDLMVFEKDFNGVGIDLAAGNLWAVPYILKGGNVSKLYCLEYSNHRLFKLGPKVLEYYKVPYDKVVLVLGSFYDLKLKENSLDFVLLSQAFHHADDPFKLLSEINRVLNRLSDNYRG